MTEIIMHEKAWVEDALSRLTMGRRPGRTLSRLARYYFAEGYRKSEIPALLEAFMMKCDPKINLVKWQPFLESVVKSADRFEMIEVDRVVITKGEMDRIQGLDGRQRQKLMFTLLCLAKYANAVNAQNNGWVNMDTRDIFALANITMTTTRQSLLINDLWQAGFIGYSKVVDNVNLRVLNVDTDGEAALEVTDMRNLGNQYMMYLGDSYMACQECGIVIRKTGRSHKYCRDCYADINHQRATENYHSSVA